VNYLLDTNAVIALLKNQPSGVRNRLRRVASRGVSIAVSTVVLYELWYGVARTPLSWVRPLKEVGFAH
jgi:tRNA(fMet)-specific endonuclease VapC